jgi:predicted Rossmann fold nucleotide-binding protein DprA/Smf involved in DNA uptake
MADFLDEKRKEIHTRLQELKPLVDEYHRLEAAVQALDGVKPATAAAPRRARSTTTRVGKGTGRRGRPRGSGARRKQALDLVRSNPGIRIPELADKMGIKPNYLYRVLPDLQKEGLVRREGGAWHARDAT